MTTTTRTWRFSTWSAVLALTAGFAAPAPAAAADLAYGYFRTLDGYANLIQAASDTRVDLEVNYPVLAGDRVELPPGSRVEAVLADDTYVRIGGDTELVFDRLALSGDTEDDTTLLRLLYGEIQLEVRRDDSLGIEPLRVDTVNATIYLPRSGSFRIASDGSAWTEVVARDGYAEVTTERGSALVRTDEQVTVAGDRWARVTVDAAPARNSLERWGEDLLLAARSGYADEVEPRLGYAAASLSEHGGWVEVGGQRAWRPRVSVAWRPYYDGWWHYTPSGLTWVPREPWGWVTHHYGWWDYADPWGWVWYPGYVYSPASVYWYWGPSYVAWVPLGYYRSYYPHYPWRFGVYGWAGGYSGIWTTWTFCPTYAFGRRDTRVYYRSGAELTRRGELRDLPRGIITTDTRPLTPDRWKSPAEAHAALKAAAVRQGKLDPAGSLPDVSDFVARKRELSSDTARAISASKGDPVLGRTPVTRVRDSRGGELKRDTIAGKPGEISGRPSDWTAGRRPADDSAAGSRGRSDDYGKSDYGKGGSDRSVRDRGDYGKSGSAGGVYGRGDDAKSGSDRGTYGRGDDAKSGSDRGRYDRGVRDRGDYGKRPEGPPTAADRGYVKRPSSGTEDTTDAGSWRDRGLLGRPSSDSRPEGKVWERGSASASGSSAGETPPVRRVLEGVRDYRERSRGESGSSSSGGYSRPSGGDDRGSSARSGSSGSYRKPSSSSGSSRSGSSARSSGSSGSKSSARSSDSGRSRSSASRSSGSRSGGSRSKPSGGNSGGVKRRGG